MNLLDALKSLDHTNDDHWTADNQPLMTELYTLVGSPIPVVGVAVFIKTINAR